MDGEKLVIFLELLIISRLYDSAKDRLNNYQSALGGSCVVHTITINALSAIQKSKNQSVLPMVLLFTRMKIFGWRKKLGVLSANLIVVHSPYAEKVSVNEESIIYAITPKM